MKSNLNDNHDAVSKLLVGLPEDQKLPQLVEEYPSLWFSKRLLVSIMLFLCFVNFQILRNNINITVVEMTTNKSHIEGNITIITRAADFQWDTETIGLTISMLSYGGLFSLPGGLLVDLLGGSLTCSFCMMVAGILTVLHPVILYWDFYAFLALRFITGLFEIIFYVSTSKISSVWFPKKERSMLISFSFNGTNVGIAAIYPFCGYLVHKYGWQMAFYVTGIMSIIVSILFWVIVKNKPSQDHWISKKELAYILEETDTTTKTKKIDHPYKSIITSVPVWSLNTVLFVFMWMASITGAYLPLYTKDMTNKETDEIGWISSIPNAVYIIMFPIAGTFMDYWKNNSNVTLTIVHKTITCFGFLSASLCFIVAGFMSDFTVTLISFVVIQITTSAIPLITQILQVNLAPDHCSVVGGICTSFFAISAIVSQTVTGFMIEHRSPQEWSNCYYLAALFTTLGAVIFAIFGSSETQPWSSSNTKETLCSFNEKYTKTSEKV